MCLCVCVCVCVCVFFVCVLYVFERACVHLDVVAFVFTPACVTRLTFFFSVALVCPLASVSSFLYRGSHCYH